MDYRRIRIRVLRRARLVTLGYAVITLLMLAVSTVLEQDPGKIVWLIALGLLPFSFLTVELIMGLYLSPLKLPGDTPLSPLRGLRLIPYVMTFLLYFYNFFIFVAGVYGGQSGPEKVFEAIMLALLVGGYLFFGFEVSTHPLAEADLLQPVKKPFPSFLWRILVTFTVFTIFPLLFIFLKILWSHSQSMELSSTAQQIAPTLIRVAFVMPPAGVLLALTIVKPIRKLNHAMKRIEEEDYGAHVPSYSSDELGLMGQGFNRMVEGLAEREKMRNALGVYVSPQVARRILNDDLKPGGNREDAVILFTDLRNFTTMSEITDPQVVVSMLNRYFEKMVQAVENHGGFVNKFIGDAILAVFGAPVRLDQPERAAVDAALEMMRELEHLNRTAADEGFPELRMGVGIHQGPVILGNVGSNRRLEYTVMGDTVNTASRIEGATKKIGQSILVSDRIISAIDSISWKGPWRVQLKGKNEPISLYSVESGVESGQL